MWKLVLMSSKWYAVHYEDGDDLLLDIEDSVFEHVNQGTIIALSDDLETFADEMGIELSDIETVER